MVASELLEQLNKIRGNFTWHYDGKNKRIRAKLRFRAQNRLFDPIGAVCYTRTGLVFDEEQWLRAAEKLGLSHIDAADLTAAANNVCLMANHHYMARLRSQIIGDLRPKHEKAHIRFRMPDTFLGFVSLLIFGKPVSPSLTPTKCFPRLTLKIPRS